MKKFFSVCLLLAAFSSSHAHEANDSIITIAHPQTVSFTKKGRFIDLIVKSTENEKERIFEYNATGVRAHKEQSDTTVVFNSSRLFTLETDKDTLTVRVYGEENDSTPIFDYQTKCPRTAVFTWSDGHNPKKTQTTVRSEWLDKQKDKNGINVGGFYLGFITPPGAPDNYDTDMSASIEIGFEPIQYRRYTRSGKQYFSIGLGFNWRNYRMTGHNRFVKNPATGYIETAAYPEEANHTSSSRIKVFSVNFPFRYTWRFNKDWQTSIATILSVNPHASIESKYKIPDEGVTHRVKESENDIKQQKVSVDFMAQIHWKGLGVYAKYSPCRVLTKDFGPHFTTFSVGISLGY